MSETILDLSGQKGLADNFAGDSDRVTPQPNLRIAKSQSDLVQGIFNPYLRDGYLAPATNSSTSLTFDVTPTVPLGCVEFDHRNQDVYWGDRANAIYVGNSLTDTSLLKRGSLEISALTKYWGLHDLQIYQLNGEPKLFMSGVGSLAHAGISSSGYPSTPVATIPATNDSAWTIMAIKASSTTVPNILLTQRDYSAAASTTLTTSVVVPSGTNTALNVIVFNSGGGTVNTMTWNGTSVPTVSGSTGANSGVSVHTLVSPAAGTFNLVTTFSGSVPDRLHHIIVTDQTDQTNASRATTNVSASVTTLTGNKRIISDKQLTLLAAYSDEVLTSTITNATQIFNTTNTYGSDLLYSQSVSGMYLQVGVVPLAFSSVSQAEASWISGTASGATLEIVYTDNAFLRTADNGFAYIFADNKVHKIDGTTAGGVNGTITRNVLLFPEYFMISDAIDYRSRLYISVHQYNLDQDSTTLSTFTGKCGIYIWNRISTQLTSADFIELPGVREIKKLYSSPDGQLKMIVVSNSGLTELRQFGYNDSGGVVFPVFKRLGIGAHPQFPDGVSTGSDKVFWAGNDGKVYCEKEKYVTQLFEIKAPGTTTTGLANNISPGATFFGNGLETANTGFRTNKQAITFSYLDGATHFAKKIYPFDLNLGNNSVQTPHRGDVYSGVTLIPVTSVVRNVRVYNAPVVGTGPTVIATVNLFFNQSTTIGMTKTVTKDEAKRGYIDFKINKPYIHAIQVEIEWATAITLDGDIYLPSAAVITHDDSKTQSPDNG